MKKGSSKKYITIKEHIAIILSTVAIILATVALILAKVNVACSALEFSGNNLLTFISILFTVVGVVFTLYFVIIGVNVSHIKKNLEHELFEIGERKEEIKKSTEYHANSLYDYFGNISALIKILASGEQLDGNSIKHLKRAQSIFACQTKYMSVEKRKSGILSLASNSENINDIEYVEKIIMDEFEPKDVVLVAEHVKKELEKKFDATSKPKPVTQKKTPMRKRILDFFLGLIHCCDNK